MGPLGINLVLIWGMADVGDLRMLHHQIVAVGNKGESFTSAMNLLAGEICSSLDVNLDSLDVTLDMCGV